MSEAGGSWAVEEMLMRSLRSSSQGVGRQSYIF